MWTEKIDPGKLSLFNPHQRCKNPFQPSNNLELQLPKDANEADVRLVPRQVQNA